MHYKSYCGILQIFPVTEMCLNSKSIKFSGLFLIQTRAMVDERWHDIKRWRCTDYTDGVSGYNTMYGHGKKLVIRP